MIDVLRKRDMKETVTEKKYHIASLQLVDP